MYSLHPTLMCQASYILLLSKTKVSFFGPESYASKNVSAFQNHDRFSSDQFEMAITQFELPIFFQTSGRLFSISASSIGCEWSAGGCQLRRFFFGAGDEDRTRNFQLGKLTLYH